MMKPTFQYKFLKSALSFPFEKVSSNFAKKCIKDPSFFPTRDFIPNLLILQVSGQSFGVKMFPRAAAHAERLWTNPETGYLDAQQRLVDHSYRLMQRGIASDGIQVFKNEVA